MRANILSNLYFQQEDVVALAKDLLGKRIVTMVEGVKVSGIINETEAYAGAIDKASHAYGNRRTKRTEIMYKGGGHIYVYLCYGMHHLLNIVTHKKDVPHAILIRSIVPERGLETIKIRRGMNVIQNLTNGPGKVAKALGIDTSHTGLQLGKETNSDVAIWIEEGIALDESIIKATPRIGIDYAEEDKNNPWRFIALEKKISIKKQIDNPKN